MLKTGKDPLLEEYADVFEGLGKLDGKYGIVTDKSMKPVVHPPRWLPVAMTEHVQRKLEEMTADDVIAKVDQPTHIGFPACWWWVSRLLKQVGR